MRFSYVKKKVWAIGPVGRYEIKITKDLFDFLDAADQLHILIGVLFE